MVASMKESEKTPLASLYGAVQGLAELGPEVVKVNYLINGDNLKNIYGLRRHVRKKEIACYF